MPHRCLIVEPDARSAETISREFPAFGFRATLAPNCEHALGMLRQWCFDAIVVDAEAFGARYLQVLRRLQGSSRSPLVLLAPAQDEREQILGLESGATEIVVKPASSRLITTKLRRLIEAVGARDADANAPQIRLGPLAMHAQRAEALVAGVPVRLTLHEFELLFLLASRPGEFVDRQTIAAVLRGPGQGVGRGADVHVYRIRKKLKALGVGDRLRLETIYGRGYCLSLRDDADCFEIVANA